MFNDGHGIDYGLLATGATFAEYKVLTRELLYVDLTTLDEHARIAFFLSMSAEFHVLAFVVNNFT